MTERRGTRQTKVDRRYTKTRVTDEGTSSSVGEAHVIRSDSTGGGGARLIFDVALADFREKDLVSRPATGAGYVLRWRVYL